MFIRKARHKDRHEMKMCNERNLSENYILEFWTNTLLQHPGLSLVLCDKDSGHVKGYLLSDSTIILSFAIDQECRKQGWGTQLLSTFFQLEGLFSTISLHVRVTNEGAIALYKKHGFEVTEEITEYYRNPTENGFIMQRKM